jgi:hypothetical protein
LNKQEVNKVGTVNPAKGKKGIHISISAEALQLLEDKGITERKRGEAIEKLIIEKFSVG